MTTVLAMGRGHRFATGTRRAATGTRRATPARARLVAGSRRSRSPSATVRCRAGQGAGRPGEEKKKKKWSLRRFAGQLLFFRGGGLKRVATFPVRLVGKAVGLVRGKPKTTVEGDVVEVLFEAEAEGGLGEEAAAGAPVVMVAGATGGVGKRCVATLLSRGARVRCLVRDAAKARAMLTASDCLDGAAPGSRLELCAADITQPKTLLPEHFEGVERVVCATACKVAPKEGDTENRDKYYQGIKFFDPEIVGDTPQAVDFGGVKNLLSAFQAGLGVGGGQDVLQMPGVASGFGSLDDVVMGGVSESSARVAAAGDSGLVFSGVVRTENNGGFASVRTRNLEPRLDLSAGSGLRLRLSGGAGLRYKVLLRTDPAFDAVGYACSFDTSKLSENEWEEVEIPFASFKPVFRAKTVPADEAPVLDPSNICSVQLMLSKFEYDGELNPKFEAGEFELRIASMEVYSEGEVDGEEGGAPRFVYVSSAGVTRPNRPGINVDEEPPAVKLNDALGGILTYKLEAEDLVRRSGLSHCVVRPCALTEEDEGADLVVSQGDTIRGKVARQDVASFIASAVMGEVPSSLGATFELGTTQPFPVPYVAGEGEGARTGEEWEEALRRANVRPGVTGKTVDGKYTATMTEEEAAAAEEEEARSPQDAWYSW